MWKLTKISPLLERTTFVGMAQWWEHFTSMWRGFNFRSRVICGLSLICCLPSGSRFPLGVFIFYIKEFENWNSYLNYRTQFHPRCFCYWSICELINCRTTCWCIRCYLSHLQLAIMIWSALFALFNFNNKKKKKCHLLSISHTCYKLELSYGFLTNAKEFYMYRRSACFYPVG